MAKYKFIKSAIQNLWRKKIEQLCILYNMDHKKNKEQFDLDQRDKE